MSTSSSAPDPALSDPDKPPGSRSRRGLVGRSGGFDRADNLGRLANEEFDLLVIGGGVTGAGVALDAAARGLRTALVERFDFASGTSSKSSKMVHGGLRYLQQREFRLVYENLAERQRLLNNAPHLVEPLPFLIPIFGSAGVVNATMAKAYATALWLYDLTGGLRIGKRHRRISASEVLAHLPTLRADRLAAGFLYYDARTDDARLTLAIARTAAAHGAAVVNYAPVVSVTKDAAGSVSGALIAPSVVADPGANARSGFDEPDAMTWTSNADGPDPVTVQVRARVVVNAAGVWADEVRALDEETHPRSIRPAKGVHIAVPASKLPCDIAAVIPVPGDRRSIFVVPWGDEVYLGTTDTDYAGPLDDPQCTRADADYILGAVNAFVDEPLAATDITGTWAGLRPLLAPDNAGHHKAGSRTADLSRRHQVRVSPSGLVSITGGKLTTYRKMAADAVDAAVRQLGSGRRTSPTKKLALWGAAGTHRLRRPEAAAALKLDGELLDHLVSRYGGEADQVATLIRSDPAMERALVEGEPYRAGEAIWSVRHEMALTLADVLARRTRALLRNRGAALAAAVPLARLIGPELGWDQAEEDRQVEQFKILVLREAQAVTTTGTP